MAVDADGLRVYLDSRLAALADEAELDWNDWRERFWLLHRRLGTVRS